MLLQPFPDALNRESQHIRIRQTALNITFLTFAIYQRKIFRMLLIEVLWNERVQAVNKRIIDSEWSPLLFREVIMLAIQALTRSKIRAAHHLTPKDVSILQSRNISLVDLRQPQAVEFRNSFNFRSKPTHTELLFQKSINSIQGTARSATGNDEAVAVGPQHKSIRA